MEPGDVIAMYATAKDARTTSRTDMMFIEAEPFERNYTQSQQMGGGGGGGGGGDDSSEISQRAEGNHRGDLERAARQRRRIRPRRTRVSWPKCRRS